ncbi:hypothetical protein HMI54_012779, partial [Coelomomyces lativittatus]
VVAYHPTLFKAWKNLSWSSSNPYDPEAIKKEMVLQLAAHGISLFSPHSALDSAYQGINDWLASGLPNIASIQPMIPTSASTLDRPEGQGRLVTFNSPMELNTLLPFMKKHLNVDQLRVATCPLHHPITKLGVCAGSGGSLLSKIMLNSTPPCKLLDAFWTGEISHHETLHAIHAQEVHVIASEHTLTERPYLKTLKHRLETEFEFHVVLSQLDQEPLQWK